MNIFLLGILTLIVIYLFAKKSALEGKVEALKVQVAIFEYLKQEKASFKEGLFSDGFYTNVIYLCDEKGEYLGKICNFCAGGGNIYYPKTMDDREIKILSTGKNFSADFDEAAYELILYLEKQKRDTRKQKEKSHVS